MDFRSSCKDTLIHSSSKDTTPNQSTLCLASNVPVAICKVSKLCYRTLKIYNIDTCKWNSMLLKFLSPNKCKCYTLGLFSSSSFTAIISYQHLHMSSYQTVYNHHLLDEFWWLLRSVTFCLVIDLTIFKSYVEEGYVVALGQPNLNMSPSLDMKEKKERRKKWKKRRGEK